jgi:hypothetical protein
MAQGRRQQRERQRISRLAAAARTRQVSALDLALAEITAAFDETAAIVDFKIRVERRLQLGPEHPALRARFGARAALLVGRSLDASVALVERWWRDERKAFHIASALGGGSRVSLETLRELRLILRLMRFKRMKVEFQAVADALCGRIFAIAAE